jgi:bacteriocin-like protein
MKTLSDTDLAHVTGGKPDAALDTSRGSSSNNDQVLSALQGIQSSLKDLGQNQNQGLFGGTNGLMFMTMALAMNRRSEVVVCGNGGNCGRRGFSWRVW